MIVKCYVQIDTVLLFQIVKISRREQFHFGDSFMLYFRFVSKEGQLVVCSSST